MKQNFLHAFGALTLAAVAQIAFAQERELEQDVAPGSVDDIDTAIQSVFRDEEVKPPLFPGARKRLEGLPAFISESSAEGRFRTYYLRRERVTDEVSEAWAAGGSLYFGSGQIADVFSVELEAFTSQPVSASDSKDGTQLLAPGQEGYTVLGIANGQFKVNGLRLTVGRQYLDLPYINRNDSRMTPNTFESVTIAKPEGKIRFSAGYTHKVKRRNSDEFRNPSETLGLDKTRGLSHAGAVWVPNEDFRIGTIAFLFPDISEGLYTELGLNTELENGWKLRFDGQHTYQGDNGDDLLGGAYDGTWNLGLRTSASYAGAVFRVAVSITGSDGPIVSAFGSNPSYINLMQRAFTAADEKAVLLSTSYDFAQRGIAGLSGIVNYARSKDGKITGVAQDLEEINVTMDYKIARGLLKNFSLRLRASHLDQELADSNGTDLRAILRYDVPVM